MADQRINVHIPSHPSVLDSVHLQNIHLPLPAAPDPWHRPGKPQPCTASLKLSYSSAVAAATADDVALSIDYGKLYRRLDAGVKDLGGAAPAIVSAEGRRRDSIARRDAGQDVRGVAGIVANCALGLLDETAAGVRRMEHVHGHGFGGPKSSYSTTADAQAQQTQRQRQTQPPVYDGFAKQPAIDGDFGQCEVRLHLPKAHLRAEDGLRYRSLTVWGYRQPSGDGGSETAEKESGRCAVVLEEEFRIDGIRCYCILGVNSHERVERQAVIVSLEFKGPGQLAWGSTVVDTYQEMTRVVAEVEVPTVSIFDQANCTARRTNLVPNRRSPGYVRRAYCDGRLRQ